MIKDKNLKNKVDMAKKAAIKILVHNFKLNEPNALPMASGWEYYEPYTRDLMIASLGILITEKNDYEDEKGYEKMINKFRKLLETLAQNQTKRGHILGWANDPKTTGSSDTTPLFILAVGLFREVTGIKKFLDEAVKKAMTWMEYQSPDDSSLVAQLEANDWRDEQWGFQGYCLFVNAIVYSYLRFLNNKDDSERAEVIKDLINLQITDGLLTTNRKFYVMCVSKRCVKGSSNISDFNKWFDLLGNSLAILSGIASRKMSKKIISYVEKQSEEMRSKKELALDLPPNFFPFVNKRDPQWCPSYDVYGKPGNYLNGGIWPFVCGFYVAALVAAGEMELAEHKLDCFTDLIKLKREPSSITEWESLKNIPFGFNEWFRAQNDWFNGETKTKNKKLMPPNDWFKGKKYGKLIMGHNWQTWSAAMYLYAAKCVETRSTPFFDKIRGEENLAEKEIEEK